MRSFTNLVWKPFGRAEPHCPMTFLEIFSSKKFSRVVVYCSVIKVPVVLSFRQLWYFIKSLSLCQELFYFSFLSFPLSSRSASSDSLYRLSHQQDFVNNFFHLFFRPFQSLISAPSPPVVPPPRLRSWSFSCGREFLSSATGAILPPLELIVNVFSIFYLFQTIHTILTFFCHYLSFMPVTLLSQILTLISLFTLSLDIQYSSIYRKNHLLILPVVLCHT